MNTHDFETRKPILDILQELYSQLSISPETASELTRTRSLTGAILEAENLNYLKKESAEVHYYLTPLGMEVIEQVFTLLRGEKIEKYFDMTELLGCINYENRGSCENILRDHASIFNLAKGSSVKHQAWEGGYLDHIVEAMNIAIRFYNNLSLCRKLPFSLSDALLILFLHDLEKPWKYGQDPEKLAEVGGFEDYQDFINSKIKEYNFQLTDDHVNALKYIHGEGADYDPTIRIQGELSSFVHCCDTISARIWHDQPKTPLQW